MGFTLRTPSFAFGGRATDAVLFTVLREGFIDDDVVGVVIWGCGVLGRIDGVVQRWVSDLGVAL